MPQCQEKITYSSGRSATCILAEHSHVLHQFVYDDVQAAPSPESKPTDVKDLLDDLLNFNE
jgi:hypothetical protein